MPVVGLITVEDAVVVVPVLLMDVIAGLRPAPVVAEVSLGVVVEDAIVLLACALIEVIATLGLRSLTACEVALMATLGLVTVEDVVGVVPLLLMDVIPGLRPGLVVAEISLGVAVEDAIALLP